MRSLRARILFHFQEKGDNLRATLSQGRCAHDRIATSDCYLSPIRDARCSAAANRNGNAEVPAHRHTKLRATSSDREAFYLSACRNTRLQPPFTILPSPRFPSLLFVERETEGTDELVFIARRREAELRSIAEIG